MKKPVVLLFFLILSSSAIASVSFKGLPYAYYGSDTGLGIGAFSQINKKLSSNTHWKLYAEINFTTKGEQIHKLFLTLPNRTLAGFQATWSFKGIYENIPYENYFGYGNQTTVNLVLTNYYAYHRETPRISANLNILLYRKKRYSFNAFISLNFENTAVWPSPKLPSSGKPLLFIEKPIGANGGSLFYPIIGVSLDSRDNPYSSTSGRLYALYFEWSSSALGSHYDYIRFSMFNSIFVTLIPDLVLADRLVWDVLSDGAPFFKAEYTGGPNPKRAIGGRYSIRGIPFYRFLDNVKLINNFEIRWTPIHFNFLGDHGKIGTLLFCDTGRVWHRISDMNLKNFYLTWGTGLRLHWGNDFILSADFAFWQGPLTGIYIGVGEMF